MITIRLHVITTQLFPYVKSRSFSFSFCVCLTVKLNANAYVYNSPILAYIIDMNKILFLITCTLFHYHLEYLVAVRAKVGEMVRINAAYAISHSVSRGRVGGKG